MPATVEQFKYRLPGDGGTGAPVFLAPSLLLRDSTPNEAQPGSIDTVSNFGVPAGADWARMRGAFMMPITMGTARAESPAPGRTAFFARFSLRAIRFIMLTSIRFLRFDPVTPDTRASVDAKYSW